MKPRAFRFAASAASIALLACASIASAQDGMVHPFTRGAYQTLGMLKQALVADRMNSRAWTSDNPTLDAFYAAKAREVQCLIDRLERREPVSSLEVERALDTRRARLLSGQYWDVPDVPTHY